MTTESPNASLRLSSRECLWLGAIALGALVLRLVWLPFDPAIPPDGFHYARLAEAMRSGNLAAGLSAYWPPLYPFLVALAGLLVRDIELAGRLVSILAGVALLYPAYLLARNIWHRTAGYTLAAMLAIDPALIRNSTRLLSDSAYTLLFVSAALFGLLALFDDRRSFFFWCGVAYGGAYLTRPEAFGYVWLIVALVPAVAWLRSRLDRRSIVMAGLLLVGFASVATPYVFYLREQTGGWTISAKFSAHLFGDAGLWYRLLPGEDLTYADRLWSDRPSERRAEPARETAAESDAGEAPAVAPRGLGTRLRVALHRIGGGVFHTYRSVLPQVVPPLTLLLAGAGLFYRRTGPEQTAKEIYLALLILATLAGYAVTLAAPRYILPQLPLVYAWVALGWLSFARRFLPPPQVPRPGGRRWRAVEWAVLPAMIAVFLGTGLQEATFPLRSGEWAQGREIRQAGRWLAEHAEGSPVIMGTSPVVAFYARTYDFFYLPDDTLEAIRRHATRRGASYIAVDEVKGRRYEFLTPLIRGEEPVPGFELVYRSGDDVWRGRVRIYRPVPADAAPQDPGR